MRIRFLNFSVRMGALLGACVSAPTLSWPEHGEDPYAFVDPEEARKIVDERFAHASSNVLGTADDVAAIGLEIAEDLEPRAAEVREIRWLSPTLVMADTYVKYAGFFYVVEKKGGKWSVLTHYLLWRGD